MSGVAVAIGGAALAGGVGGAIISSNGAKDAANTQAQAAGQAAQLQYDEYLRQRGAQQPWIDAGVSALPKLQDMASQAPQFTAQDFQNNKDPGYDFDLQQGQQALERSAAARGGLQTGGTLKDLTSYAQGMASNEYQNAYNRYMNNQSTQFNRLASVAGIGQTATGALGQAGANMANGIGNIAMSNANAQGAASMAQGNIWGSTLGSLGSSGANMGMQYSMMNRMFPQSPAPTAAAGYAASAPSAPSSGGYSLGVDYSGLTSGI